MIARPVRFLVLRGGAIGDFIVTLPVFQALRTRWPDAYIELIGYPHIARLALEGGLVNKVDSLDRANIALFFARNPSFPKELCAFIRSFDLIFSFLHDKNGLVRENLLLAGARQVIYGSPLIPEDVHAVDHLLAPLESLALYEKGATPDLRLDDKAREEGRELLASIGGSGPALLLHPGSGSPRKNWPIERFVALAELAERDTAWTPVFLLGEADETARIALEQLRPTAYTLTGLDLIQVAQVVSNARVHVGNDSGITHLAAALSVPTIALFGPSSSTQWGPRGKSVSILDAGSSDLADLPVEQVWSALRGLSYTKH